MKSLLTFVLLSFTSILTFGQIEFPNNSNGLIYNDSTIKQLQSIVDSLQLQFENTATKTYYSKPQARGHYFALKQGDLKAAKKDLENNISFEDFFKKYPEVEMERDLLVVQLEEKNLQGEHIVTFSADLHYIKQFHAVSISKNRKQYDSEPKNNLVFTLVKRQFGSAPYLAGFFFKTEIASKPLPERYARMIQYTSLMIDSTTSKFKQNATYEHQYFPKLHSGLSKTEQIKWLDYLRGLRIRAGCGRSPAPKIHDFNIAQLAAETSNWRLFLKAHLDILYLPLESKMFFNNEKKGRNTYVKELEAINIDINSLLLGMDLQIKTPTQWQYAANHLLHFILSETLYQEEIKNELLSMIKNKELDDHNRVVAYYQFLNYTNQMKDQAEKKANMENLQKAVATLPDYLATFFLK